MLHSLLTSLSFQGPSQRKQVAMRGPSAAGIPRSSKYLKMEATDHGECCEKSTAPSSTRDSFSTAPQS